MGSKDNFSSTLKDIEPFLSTEAGLTFYRKSVRRIGNKANELGIEMPAGYALEAKATAKRREKQNTFVQQKIEEAAAAAAVETEAEVTTADVAEEELVAA